MKLLRLIPETILLYLMFGIFALLPPVAASNLGGFIGRTIGPKLAASRKARTNVKNAMPEKSDAEVETIVIEMWDNLGRVMAEYPHLEKIARDRTIAKGDDIIVKLIQEGKAAVLFGAHLGNWEVNCAAMLVKHNVAPRITYRAPNNPMAEWLLQRARTLNGRLIGIPKARSSAKELMNAMKENIFIGILVDQKYNEGIAVNFFGRPAMSNPVAVMLCQKYNAPLIPVRNVRTGPAQFELTVYDPVPLEGVTQEQAVQQTQTIMEGWIREKPGQWLWLHRRWDSKIN